jgi:hypothetical protein
MVLAGMLAAGAAGVAFAQAKDRQMESRGYRASRSAPQETAKQPYDRQMESRGYRRATKSATPPSAAYEPPDRQLVSRGYRHHHRRHHKS